jgi:hypothetical protein
VGLRIRGGVPEFCLVRAVSTGLVAPAEVKPDGDRSEDRRDKASCVGRGERRERENSRSTDLKKGRQGSRKDGKGQ